MDNLIFSLLISQISDKNFLQCKSNPVEVKFYHSQLKNRENLLFIIEFSLAKMNQENQITDSWDEIDESEVSAVMEMS